MTSNVSPSLRNSRHCLRAGLPASTPERFSLKTLSQPFSLLQKLNVEALPDATHSCVPNGRHLPFPFILEVQRMAI